MRRKPDSRRRRSLSDPLSAALLPPPNETPLERERRLHAEFQAKQISDGIDEMIRKERFERKKTKTAEVKVLLLGQSESGKSTTLKQFQLMHSPAAFHVERIAWRPVIYLNLVRSIRRILEAVTPEVWVPEEHEDTDTASMIGGANGQLASATPATKIPNLEQYQRQLAPLTDLEDKLTRMLSSPDTDEAVHVGPTPPSWEHHDPTANNNRSNGRPSPTIYIPQHKHALSTSAPTTGASSSNLNTPMPSPLDGHDRSHKEVAVHITSNWKKAFSLGGKEKSPKSAHTGEIAGWWEDPDDPVHALNACSNAMLQLWKDAQVKRRLAEKRVRLEESSGFYLDEIPRITALKYIPRDEDVLKARLKTMGVVEHTFVISNRNQRGAEWKIYDVGGSRNQRQAWAPYFEDVNAVIFLAPISAFDQVLEEDVRVNRLEDSLLLWKSLISNRLLANVNIVLFLNKCDLLQAKLNAGVRLSHHMISYGDRPNDFESVSKYFRTKFGALHQNFTPNREREVFIHFTAVTDTRRTAKIISNVRDIIIKANLQNLQLM